ncbi:MAG: diacylglycerol kinase family lipid kinase [Spirochaetales bacterium]|nr:diacylglycerol kinase family lipid kinase [Spirochaetales bacterium]
MDRKTFFVVNPHSSHGRTAAQWPEWRRRVQDVLGRADYALTERHMHAAELAGDALTRGYELVVAVGGDGTLNEVLNGFFSAGVPLHPEAALGYLPSGTGADFARTMGHHERSIEEHIACWREDRLRRLDCGEVRFLATTGEETRRLFINESSLGFSADTAEAVNRASKHFRGKLPFFLGVLRTLGALRTPVLHVVVDGTTVHRGPTLLVAVANGKYFGGSMMIAPNAEVDDGQFDVIVIDGMSRLQVLRKIPKIYSGSHLSEPEVHAYRGSQVHIQASGTEVLLEMDGEQPGKLSADFRISHTTVPFLG